MAAARKHAPSKVKRLLDSFIYREGHKESDTNPSDDTIDHLAKIKRAVEKSQQNNLTGPQPRDREAFFNRVESFSTLKWFAKPAQLSPLRCAQFGWENVDIDIIKCVSCKEILCTAMPKAWDPDTYTDTCRKLEDSLITAHKKFCPWPDSSSPDSFLTIPLLDHIEALNDFSNRVDSLLSLEACLPKIDMQTMSSLTELSDEKCDETVDSLLRFLHLLALTEGTTATPETRRSREEKKSAVLLSLCGWSTRTSKSSDCHTLTCQWCRRQAGLWNFSQLRQQKEDEGQRSEVEGEDGSHGEDSGEASDKPPTKRRKLRENTNFDPVVEHRSWCPWVTSEDDPTTAAPATPAGISPAAPAADPTATAAASPPAPEPTAQHDSHLTVPLDGGGSVTPTTVSRRPSWKLLLHLLLHGPSPARTALTNKSLTPPNAAWKAVKKILGFWKATD